MEQDTSTAVAPAPTAQPPRSLQAEEEQTLRGRVEKLIERVRSGPEDRELVREVGDLGEDAQRRAGESSTLLQTRVGTLLSELDGEGQKIPQNLMALRKTMDTINPHVLSQRPQGFISRLLRRTPVIGDVLADIATRYETVQTQIDAITDGLRAGKDTLLQDSIELERLYAGVQEAQTDLQKAAFMGELLWEKLEKELEATSDPNEQNRLRTLVHKVAMRVQDLRTMEQVNAQFFVSIDITMQNNDHLSDAISRTLTVTRSLLTVGLAIQAALVNQKKILSAVQKTQEYTAEMLQANAAAVRQQTSEVGELYQSPVLALDKVKGAYDELIGAMDELDRVRRAGTESARTGVQQLTAMSDVLSGKAEALKAAREFETPE
jgi:uncharacterized protein YaaN involved in tellurite resistance